MAVPSEANRFWNALSPESSILLIDESFRLDGDKKYYILAAALVLPEVVETSRCAVREVLDGEIPHASHMFKEGRFESLKLVVTELSKQHDGSDVVVYCPIESSDHLGLKAREVCVKRALDVVSHELSSFAVIFDSHKDKRFNTADRKAIQSLQKFGHFSSPVRFAHFSAGQEPLLALPDVIAWTYRQEFSKNDKTWFEPFREATTVHRA